MSETARFCVKWLIALVILFAVIAVINIAVDPYDVMGAPRIAGFNQFKVEAPYHTVLAKTYQIRRTQPTTVLFGSSVVNVGLDPKSSIWPAAMRPVYNFGVPAMGVQGNYEALKYAAAVSAVRNAIVVSSSRHSSHHIVRRRGKVMTYPTILRPCHGWMISCCRCSRSAR